MALASGAVVTVVIRGGETAESPYRDVRLQLPGWKVSWNVGMIRRDGSCWTRHPGTGPSFRTQEEAAWDEAEAFVGWHGTQELVDN